MMAQRHVATRTVAGVLSASVRSPKYFGKRRRFSRRNCCTEHGVRVGKMSRGVLGYIGRSFCRRAEPDHRG